MLNSSRLILGVLILIALPCHAVALNAHPDQSLLVWDFLTYAAVASAITLLVVQAHRPKTLAVDRILVIVDWSALALVAGFFASDAAFGPLSTEAALALLLLGALALSTWIEDDNPMSALLLSGILAFGIGLSFAVTGELASEYQPEDVNTSPVEPYHEEITF